MNDAPPVTSACFPLQLTGPSSVGSAAKHSPRAMSPSGEENIPELERRGQGIDARSAIDSI